MASSQDGRREPVVEIIMPYAKSPPLVQDEFFTDPGPADALRNSDPRSDRRNSQRRAAAAHASHSFGRMGAQEVAVAYRPSTGRSFFGSLAKFVIAVSIGVGGTIAAQTETAKQLLTEQAPTLAWLLAAPPAKPVATTAPIQQIGPSGSDVEAVRRSVEQLAARQDQMAQNVAALQAVGEDIRQKLSSMQSMQAQAAAVPQPRPPGVRAPLSASVPLPPPGAAPSR
jgi:hypothetical protein